MIIDPDAKDNVQPPSYSCPPGSSNSHTVPASPTTPTAAFSREPSQYAAFTTFKPIFLVSLGKYLNKGFMRVKPPSYERPHPFDTHDVGEQEWLSFLDQVHEAGALTLKDRQRSENISILSIIPVVNMVISHGIRTYFKSQKTSSVIQVIDLWNHHYFRPRRLEVLLMRGITKLNGVDKAIGHLHTPEPVDATGLESAYMEAISREKSIHDIERYRGQQGDDKDMTFRLFVVPLAS